MKDRQRAGLDDQIAGVSLRGVKDDDTVHTKDSVTEKPPTDTHPLGRRAPEEEEGEHHLQNLT